MPVAGLPTAVEITMNSLLQSSGLSSYKIAGNPRATTIVLRFEGVMADHGLASPLAESSYEKGSVRTPHLSRGTWNRKSPSHLHRDLQRHRNFLLSKSEASKISASPASTSISPRPPREYPLTSAIKDPCTTEICTLDCKSTPNYTNVLRTRSQSLPCMASHSETSTQHEESKKPQPADNVNKTLRDDNTPSNDNTDKASYATSVLEDSGCVTEVTELSGFGLFNQNDVRQDPQYYQQPEQHQQQQQQQQQQQISPCNEKNTTETREMSCRERYPYFETFVDIHDSDKFRSYVFNLDTGIKERLLDENRNLTFKKVIMDNFEGKRSLIVQTDDLVLECDLNTFQLHRWFVIDAACRPYELMRLRHLNFFDPVNPKDIFNEFALAALCVTYTLRLVGKLIKPRYRSRYNSY